MMSEQGTDTLLIQDARDYVLGIGKYDPFAPDLEMPGCHALTDEERREIIAQIGIFPL